MEALGKSCFQEGFTPLEIPVVAARSEWRNISNGVNIVSYCALASAYHRPVRGYDLASMFTLCRTVFAVSSFKFRNPNSAFRNTLSPSKALAIFSLKVDILSILKLTSEFCQTLLID
jgi:hypothetical protein